MTSLQHPSLLMATQIDDGPMDLDQKLIKSFIEAYQKKKEFDLKYPVSHTLDLVQKHLGMSVLEDLALSSDPSSSFQLLLQIIAQLASRHGGSEQNVPPLWEDLIKMVIPDPQVITKEAANAFLGSKLKESLESTLGVHGERTQDLNAAIVNSNHSHNLPLTRPITDNSSNIVTLPNPIVSHESQVQQFNPTRTDNETSTESDSFTVNIPSNRSASPPHEDSKLGFTVFAVELLGALTNLVISSRAKHNYQAMIYTVVGCSTLAFLISSTALVLHKKRPNIAKKMQKATFLIGTFGFLGIMGMLLPASITWWFTVSAFLVCLLMFAVATLIKSPSS